MLHLKKMPNAELLDLLFQQLFDGLIKRALDFSQAYRVDLFVQAALNQMFREEVRFPRVVINYPVR